MANIIDKRKAFIKGNLLIAEYMEFKVTHYIGTADAYKYYIGETWYTIDKFPHRFEWYELMTVVERINKETVHNSESYLLNRALATGILENAYTAVVRAIKAINSAKKAQDTEKNNILIEKFMAVDAPRAKPGYSRTPTDYHKRMLVLWPVIERIIDRYKKLDDYGSEIEHLRNAGYSLDMNMMYVAVVRIVKKIYSKT